MLGTLTIRTAVAAALAAVLAASAPAGAHEPGPRPPAGVGPRFDYEPPVPGTYRLPPVKPAADGGVLDARGARRRLREVMAGRLALLSFIYTGCHDATGCPLATAVLHQVRAAVARDRELARRLTLVTVSFDLARDTPPALARYAEPLRRVRGPRWEFLVPSSGRELDSILTAYGQSIERAADGTLSHVLRVYLIDARGQIRNVYGVDFLDPRLVLADLRTLLLEERALTRDEAALARIAAPPLGLPPVPVPADTPPTAARIALGRKLFFDRRLSRNGTMSCAMCHLPQQGFTNRELARPVGVEGRSLRRNAPTLLNVAYVRQLFHDGREVSLETQALAPMLDPREMANPSPGAILARLRALPDYDSLFEQAFGAGPSLDRVGQALASYQRTLLAGNSPFDRWYFGGQATALSAEAREGFRLFTGRAGCASCHTIEARFALFTDGAFHDTGVAWARAGAGESVIAVELVPGFVVPMARQVIESVGEPEAPDLGRHEVTLDPDDRWRFRTPSLRNVALTGPYMHDGSLSSLRDVVEFYNRGGAPHPGQDPRVRPLGLDARETAALVAFLESLTGETVDP